MTGDSRLVGDWSATPALSLAHLLAYASTSAPLRSYTDIWAREWDWEGEWARETEGEGEWEVMVPFLLLFLLLLLLWPLVGTGMG